MNICLSHTSLVEALGNNPSLLDCGVIGKGIKVDRVALPLDFVPSLSEAEASSLCGTLGLSYPIDTLAVSANRRSGCRALRCHVWEGCASEAMVYRLYDGLYVSSPEMLFLQMSSIYAQQELIRFGFDLCSTYRRGNPTEFDRAPYTTVESIEEYLKPLSRRRGLSAAKHALGYVRNNSYSPKETDLAMKLGLPGYLGGEGLGMPEMNYEIALSEEAVRLLPQRRCYCDLYWPKNKVDVEYNGYSTHHGYERNAHDRTRELALRCMGIDVITAVNDQVLNPGRFDVFARQVAKALGKRIRHRHAAYGEQRSMLDALLRD